MGGETRGKGDRNSENPPFALLALCPLPLPDLALALSGLVFPCPVPIQRLISPSRHIVVCVLLTYPALSLSHSPVTATSSSSSGVTTTSNTPSGATTTPSTSSGSNTPSGTMTATGSATPTPSLPPLSVPNSNVVLDKPLPIKGYPPLFAIGTDIQFAWHYDKEPLVPPANITIEAYMTNTPATIVPIGTALPGNTKNFTWTESMQKNLTLSIATANYTLRIFDGASGRFPGAPFAGGILNNYAGFKFGLYIPSKPGSQQNPPLCATCQFDAITNGAMAALPVLSTLVLSVAVTLCSIV